MQESGIQEKVQARDSYLGVFSVLVVSRPMELAKIKLGHAERGAEA